MTFLNPFVLLGLVAAAIPILLHLLNLRKLRTIEFSTLVFLKELQQTKIRRLKLRQILLLVVRTLLVVFIVLAFARPALRGTILGSLGSHAHSTIVLILDDSFSMMGNDEHGEFFKQAKETAGKLIDLLKDGDEISLIKLSDVPQATIDPATHDFGALRTLIHESQVSSIRRPMEDALRLTAKLLQHSNNANKEVYIISDLQSTLFSEQFYTTAKNNLKLFDESNNFFFLTVGSREIANAAIDSVEVTTTILEKDKPAAVYVSVSNFGNAPLNNYVLSASLDGVKATQKSISLAPWGSTATELTVLPKRSGFIKGYVELENDAIEIDNKRYFTVFIPELINVAIVANSNNDSRFLLLALQAGNNNDESSLLKVQQTSSDKFSLLDMKNIDVMICTNIKSFTANDADRIQSFVKNGGGFILFPGDNIQRDNYNTTLLPALNIPLIDNISETSGENASLMFRTIDFEHPLFATVFEKEQIVNKQTTRNIESPNIIKTINRNVGKQERTIISLSNGKPFLSEYNLGNGKILFYSVQPTLSWSDFPLKGVFMPLIYRSAIYVSPREKSQGSLITGEEPAIRIRSGSHEQNNGLGLGEHHYKLIAPDGVEQLIKPEVQSTSQSGFITSIAFSPGRLTTPGFYELRDDSKIVSLFAANTDRNESDTRKISSNNLQKALVRLGITSKMIHQIEPGEQPQPIILQSRFGVELWQYCIGFALLMALLEMLIARDNRKAILQN